VTLNLSTGAAAAPISARKNDFYQTPEVATRALLAHQDLPPEIWEPACGLGAISRVLSAAGHVVHSTDLVDRGFGVGGRDFLMELSAPPGFDCIVTNPPFKLATEFVEHGLQLCRHVVVLCRLQFIEGRKRDGIMGRCNAVHAFINRVPMMHREEGAPEQKDMSSAIAFAWFVFDREHQGDITLRRIAWERVQ